MAQLVRLMLTSLRGSMVVSTYMIAKAVARCVAICYYDVPVGNFE